MPSLLIMRAASLSLPAFFVLVYLAGCSSSTSLEKLTPVAGKVQLDGTPLAGASVFFIPRDQTKGTGGSGVTDVEGKYEARHQSNRVGIAPGTYTVTFSKIAMPDGSPIPAGQSAADAGATEILPSQLSNPSPDQATNVVTVPETGGTFDFTLTSR